MKLPHACRQPAVSERFSSFIVQSGQVASCNLHNTHITNGPLPPRRGFRFWRPRVTHAWKTYSVTNAPVTEQAIEQGEPLWQAVAQSPDGIAFDCPSCGVTLELRHEGKNDVRGNRHGADASQPWPVQPPGDSRHLEGAT